MTQTNTDYLFQVTAPTPDRTFAPAGATDGAPKFDDHLSQASTFSGDDSRNLGSGSQRTETARYERDDRQWKNSSSEPSDQNHDNGNSTTPQTLPSNQEASSDEVRGSTSPSENADGDEHETDKSDETTATEVAGATQAAKENSPKPTSKPEPNTNTNAAATLKTAAISKKAATEAGDRKATATANGQKTNSSPLPDAVTQHADDAAKLVVNATTDAAKTSEQAVEPQAPAAEGNQSKAAKSEAPAAKSNKGSSANKDGAVRNVESVDGAGSEEIAPAVAKKVNENVDASATLAAVTITKGKSDANKLSDDDSRAGLHNDNHEGARNDAPVQTSKVDTAQLASGVPSPKDLGANTPAKGKDNEQAVKSVAAKSEPVAATFARMTKDYISGSNDSASGANDLPPIDPSRFIGRVAKAFQTAQDRGGTLQLRLSPPELGALRIELNVKDGVMSASLQTENANARRLLLDHLPALRDRLAEQNIRVDRFDVDVRREGTSGQTDTRGSQQQQFQHQPDQPAPRRQAQPQVRPREPAAPERSAITPSVSDTGLNLIV
jgi:flagellar hook-length control protein FliK